MEAWKARAGGGSLSFPWLHDMGAEVMELPAAAGAASILGFYLTERIAPPVLL